MKGKYYATLKRTDGNVAKAAEKLKSKTGLYQKLRNTVYSELINAVHAHIDIGSIFIVSIALVIKKDNMKAPVSAIHYRIDCLKFFLP